MSPHVDLCVFGVAAALVNLHPGALCQTRRGHFTLRYPATVKAPCAPSQIVATLHTIATSREIAGLRLIVIDSISALHWSDKSRASSFAQVR